MKVVLDTNILLSAILWGGVPGQILELWNSHKIEALATESILSEYISTIQRVASFTTSERVGWA